MVSIFCSNCGNKNEVGAAFCASCGNKLAKKDELIVSNQSKQSSTPVSISNNIVNQPINNQSMTSQPVQPINNQQVNVTHNNVKNGNIKLYLLGAVIGIAILVISSLIITVATSLPIYFSPDPHIVDPTVSGDGSGDLPPEEPTTTNQPATSNPSKTVIVYDNTYEGINFNSVSDAKKFIVDDSVNQKDSCPKEIVAIEERIIKNYNILAINLCEMNKDFALEVEDVIKTIYNEFPSVRGYLTNMSLVNAPKSEGYIAAFQGIFPFAYASSGDKIVIKTHIMLNTYYFLNLQRMEASMKDGSSTGHFPPNTVRSSAVAHEYGHYLSFIAAIKHYNLSSPLIYNFENEDLFLDIINDRNEYKLSLQIITEAYNNYKSKTNTTMSLLDFRSSISKYAVTKNNEGKYLYDETIAEAFHDCYLNGDKAKDASKEIVSVLKKYL